MVGSAQRREVRAGQEGPVTLDGVGSHVGDAVPPGED